MGYLDIAALLSLVGFGVMGRRRSANEITINGVDYRLLVSPTDRL
jgi:hypothetical protein